MDKFPHVASSHQSGGVHVLMLSRDVLHLDVPRPADGVRHYEVLHQVGVAVGYMADARDTLVAGVPWSKLPNNQCLNRHVPSSSGCPPAAVFFLASIHEP